MDGSLPSHGLLKEGWVAIRGFVAKRGWVAKEDWVAKRDGWLNTYR
jgi:hypothetical protein